MISIKDLNNKREWIFSITAILSTLFYFLFIFDPVLFQNGDNCGYMNLAIQFSKNLNFLDPCLPYETSLLWWPPGYAIYLSIFQKLFPYLWTIPKVFTSLLFFFSTYYLIKTLYKNSRKIIEPSLLIIIISLSSTIHLISSYLYSELLFTSLLSIFISLLIRKEKELTLITILFLSLYSIVLFSIRLIGISIPIGFSIYLIIKMEGKKKLLFLIPIVILFSFILLFLFHPNLTVLSLRRVFGLSIPSSHYSPGLQNPLGIIETLKLMIFNLVLSIKGYFFTLYPQSSFRFFYSLYSMNYLKMFLTGSVSILIITGIIHIRKTFLPIVLIYISFSLFLLLYGPLYVRLLVPLVPITLFLIIQGLNYFFNSFFPKLVLFRKFTIFIYFLLLIVDNLYLSCINPHLHMPPKFGNSSYQTCIQWVMVNVNENNTVCSQVDKYLNILRKDTGFSIPFRKMESDKSFINYLNENSVDYIIISPFYTRPENRYMDDVNSIISSYPHLFHKVYSGSDGKSFVVKFKKNSVTNISYNEEN